MMASVVAEDDPKLAKIFSREELLEMLASSIMSRWVTSDRVMTDVTPSNSPISQRLRKVLHACEAPVKW